MFQPDKATSDFPITQWVLVYVCTLITG